MSKKVDILVIGGGPAGMVCAVTAHRYYPDKKVLLIRNFDKGVVPCGIPYMFSSMDNPEQNILGTAPLEKDNIEHGVYEATKINRDEKSVSTKNGEKIYYEKLVLAVGSNPILPPIPGIDKQGVYPVRKNMKYLENMVKEIKRSKNVLVVGGGFIGIEFADEVSKIKGLNVYLVEIFPRILANSFDPEFSVLAEEKLTSKGVNILTSTSVEEIIGREKVEAVKLSGGKTINIDCVILGIGVVPNTKLAEAAGLDLGKGKGIWADEYMRTIDPDIFAIGDCAGKRDFFTRKDIPILLASTACAEARIAGANLYKLKLVRENKGTIGIYSTYINGLVLATAGHTESSAKREGFEIMVGNFEGIDKHPPTMPGVNKIKVKLVFSKQSGLILGGQIAGGMPASEAINIIGVAIQKRVSLTELETLQVATHPYLTSAPTMYPLVLAAQDACCG